MPCGGTRNERKYKSISENDLTGELPARARVDTAEQAVLPSQKKQT
jgi:hypothetical protein